MPGEKRSVFDTRQTGAARRAARLYILKRVGRARLGAASVGRLRKPVCVFGAILDLPFRWEIVAPPTSQSTFIPLAKSLIWNDFNPLHSEVSFVST